MIALSVKPTTRRLSIPRLPSPPRAEPINLTIDKENPKVVTNLSIEDFGAKGVFCRCWRSGKFPNCDGSHVKHNEEVGDNVGPLIVSKPKPKT